ncbi:MAG: bifunctional nuclease family protein [Bacteroidales bacterium]|nr:bifunctional nuclease family protein [Bacteroidales bacterium]
MEKIRLEIIGMSYSQSQSGAYAIILGEQEGKRRLPIIIGSFEAQAIAIEIEKIKTPRPLTHDLFKSFAETFHINVTEVIINKFSEGVFYAVLHCSDGKTVKEVDSRTSDAIALALRFNCPIFTYESIMMAAGIVMEDETSEPIHTKMEPDIPANLDDDLSVYAITDLQQLLKKAVESEEYEKASKIRDEITKRKRET